MSDPASVESALRRRPGIVETGLFLGMADAAVIAGDGDVQVLARSAS